MSEKDIDIFLKEKEIKELKRELRNVKIENMEIKEELIENAAIRNLAIVLAFGFFVLCII